MGTEYLLWADHFILNMCLLPVQTDSWTLCIHLAPSKHKKVTFSLSPAEQ